MVVMEVVDFLRLDNLVSITLIPVQVKHMLMEERVEQVPEAPPEVIVLVMEDLEVAPLLVIGRRSR